MSYKKRRMLAGVLAVVLTIPSGLGLSAPLSAKATSGVGVNYRYKDNGATGLVKDRVGIRSVNIDNKTYYDIHDGNPEKRLDLTDQKTFFKTVLQSGKNVAGSTDSVIGQSERCTSACRR